MLESMEEMEEERVSNWNYRAQYEAAVTQVTSFLQSKLRYANMYNNPPAIAYTSTLQSLKLPIMTLPNVPSNDSIAKVPHQIKIFANADINDASIKCYACDQCQCKCKEPLYTILHRDSAEDTSNIYGNQSQCTSQDSFSATLQTNVTISDENTVDSVADESSRSTEEYNFPLQDCSINAYISDIGVQTSVRSSRNKIVKAFKDYWKSESKPIYTLYEKNPHSVGIPIDISSIICNLTNRSCNYGPDWSSQIEKYSPNFQNIRNESRMQSPAIESQRKTALSEAEIIVFPTNQFHLAHNDTFQTVATKSKTGNSAPIKFPIRRLNTVIDPGGVTELGVKLAFPEQTYVQNYPVRSSIHHFTFTIANHYHLTFTHEGGRDALAVFLKGYPINRPQTLRNPTDEVSRRAQDITVSAKHQMEQLTVS